MEDGPDDVASSAIVSPPLNNGEAETMANFPNIDNPPPSSLKVNGDSTLVEAAVNDDDINNEADKDSSDCDALVIDESVVKPRKKKKRTKSAGAGGGVHEEFRHTNPYFSESIFELSSQYNNKAQDDDGTGLKVNSRKLSRGNAKKFRGKNGKPKLREYAQYLGLQPTVQFKCSKCLLAGFPSFQALNEHLSICNSSAPVNPPVPLPNNTTNFRVTRKVFLCSACGTYYENWNLFLHMREVHKRFICLYCLGMFSHAEKLSLHLVSKHNCLPAHFSTTTDFFNIYKDPCFLMCCDCQTVFNEQENFFTHTCIDGPPRPPIVPPAINDVPSEPALTESVPTPLPDNQSDGGEENNHMSDTQSEKGIIDTCKSTDEHQMSNKDTIVDDNQDDVRSSYSADNRDSECNSEINMIENESVVDNSNSADDKTSEKEEAIIESEHNTDDNVNFDSMDFKEEVTEDSDDNNKFNEHTIEMERSESDSQDVRRVPKVTLKLPKITQYKHSEDEDDQSDDSEKLTMEMEKESDVDVVNETFNSEEVEVQETKREDTLPTAGADIAIIELELEQPLDKFDIKLLIQKCLTATIPNCLYCNHARKIAVNGKQLGLHCIAEHRFSAIVKSITAEELIPESFNTRIMESFYELENVFFNLDSTSCEGGITFSHLFECFQCRYSSTVHKELYLHNRKLHAKAILLCIMCKTNFYSYCELICHLCPGIYALENDVHFRCCLCVNDDLPSAFRLMVHLRKKHHVCDVCLEICHDQSRLSNHVWKHKLHHLCYRCGIAYRNKPDITKHLFWKHGTESVLCKKCLQKKWPHVYHFCIPPTNFPCEECNLSFSRAVSLMVHKRLHSETYPHACSEEGCTEKFISKKLLAKHEMRHRAPVEEIKQEEKVEVTEEIKQEVIDVGTQEEVEIQSKPEEMEVEEKPKPKVDVYDLPELNLSESDSSDSEDEAPKSAEAIKTENIIELPNDEPLPEILKTDSNELETKQEAEETEDKPPPVLENIWDDFKNYQANIAKLDILTDVGKEEQELELPSILTDIPPPLTLEDALRDHDYFAPIIDTLKEQEGIPTTPDLGPDHDYCTEQKAEKKSEEEIKPKVEAVKKPGTSDSSSSSDSSSCTCGSNCSCSSASSSSSSSDSSESDSSSEEGRRRQQIRREKRRQKKTKKQSEKKKVDVEAIPPENTSQIAPIPAETIIQESDLDTTESDTDEEFYDRQPQKLASKLLAEKREKYLQMAGIGPYINGSIIDSRPSTPNTIVEEVKSKKKSKSKKKKKRKSAKRDMEARNMNNIPSIYHRVSPLTLPKNSPVPIPSYSPNFNNLQSNSNMSQNSSHLSENDSNTRASKRRRVPNKFYGYSSDEDPEKTLPVHQQAFKMRKIIDVPTPKSPLVVPPLTIKTTPQLPPTVEPISIRMSTKPGEMKVQPLRLPFTKRSLPKIKTPKAPPSAAQDQNSDTDSNSSSSEDEGPPKPKEQPALYCYCRCPYDEVSEMIGCDSDECAIEWFHFECVGIMVPPKGQWYCPDCRKKKQRRRELMQAQMSS